MVITLNLTVHVIMCESCVQCRLAGIRLRRADYYYYATAGGAKIWVSLSTGLSPVHALADSEQWKKYLTTLQITQFVIDLFIVFFASKLTVPSPTFLPVNSPLTISLRPLCLQVQLPERW